MNILTSILLICAALLTLAWLLAAQRRLVAKAARRFVALPRLHQVVLVLVVGVMTVCAQKSGSNVVFNAEGVVSNAEIAEERRRGEESLAGRDVLGTPPAQASSASPSLLNLRVTKTIDTNEIARGYALVEVRTNATVSYEMLTNGVEVGMWGKTGAYRDVVRVSLDFSHGDTCTVETRSVSEGRFGEAEPEGRASVCETRSGEIIELLNNRIIESAEASASGSDDSRRATENAEVGTVVPQAEEESLSNHNSIIRTFDYSIIDSISAQIEFFPNGDFITRSNNVECVYRRVNPDDWDDDGIANEEDDEPMVEAEASQFGPQQTLPDGANSNAYCWVDVIVPQANATFVFNAEIMEFGRRGV